MTLESLDVLRDRLLREDRVQQMVRVRAYEIYQMRGGQPGWEALDWFQAEGEVLAFLIANESRPDDEITTEQIANEIHAPEASSISEAPAPLVSVPRKATAAKPKATKKTASKRSASKKPESKAKTNRTQRSPKKEKSELEES